MLRTDPRHCLETTGTTCRQFEKEPAPRAAFTNLLTDQEERSDQEERETVTCHEPMSNTNVNAIVIPQTNVSISTEIATVAEDWEEYLDDVGVSPPSRKALQNGIAALSKETGITPDRLRIVLDFMRHDQFWGARSPQTPAALLRRADNGRKIIDNVLAQMKTDKGFAERLLWESLEHVQLNV